MYHVSKISAANRLLPPPHVRFAEPAETNLAQWYGLGGGCDIRNWGVMLHGRGKRNQ